LTKMNVHLLTALQNQMARQLRQGYYHLELDTACMRILDLVVRLYDSIITIPQATSTFSYNGLAQQYQ
jgi:hypothetical protein